MQLWVEQQARINHVEMMLKAERKHIKKNREDLEAYKVVITERAEAAEKAERKVKDHMHNMRQKYTGKLGLLYHIVCDMSIFS